jgi:hypothetical protein
MRLAEPTVIGNPRIRFKHFHVLNENDHSLKGNLAGTCAYQDSIVEGQIDIGFVVANPNDKVLTKVSGRERATELLMREPVTITSEVFFYLMETHTLYAFLAFSTNKRLKIALRGVI